MVPECYHCPGKSFDFMLNDMSQYGIIALYTVSKSGGCNVLRLELSQVKPGMRLAKDVILPDGRLLLLLPASLSNRCI